MGIKSERRELLEVFHICGGIVVVSCIINILTFIQSELLEVEYIGTIMEILSFIKVFGVFIIIFSIVKMKQNHTEDTLQSIFKKGWHLIFLNIGFLGYYLVMNHMKSDPLMIQSSFNAFFFSIPMTIARISNKCLDSDRKIAWQKACGTYNELESKNTYLWRFKIDISNLERHFTRKDILKFSNYWDIGKYGVFFIGIMFFMQGFNIMFIVILLKPILFCIDYVFNLVASLEGECTGFYKKSRGRSGNNYYYIYVITNYDKKMEVKIKTDEELWFDEGSYIKVYYTLLSKCILKYHPVKMNTN
jgi:hypothetical protein